MSVSHNFREISEAEAAHFPHTSAWQDPNISHQQYNLVTQELQLWKQGKPFPLFDTLRECMQHLSGTDTSPATVIEIGCGVGHNARVIDASGNFYYLGIDYSEAFIDVANEWHRDHPYTFQVMDALDLSDFPDQAFDIVVHSACLLHIFNWQAALKEAARITSDYLVLHRTPISTHHRTQYFLKDAYGVECLEIWFHEMELLDFVYSHGFLLEKVWTTSSDPQCTYKTYLFKRKP